jgi:hypothetical protein
MEESLSWKADKSLSWSRNSPAFYGTRKCITLFTSAPHWDLSWARYVQSIFPRIYLRFVSVLYFHLRLGLPACTFLALGLPHPTYIIVTNTQLRGLFEKFVDSPYCSESELRGGAVTVSFSKYLPWQAMHFLQLSTHFSKPCCRPLITSKFLVSELPFHGWKSPEIS